MLRYVQQLTRHRTPNTGNNKERIGPVERNCLESSV